MVAEQVYQYPRRVRWTIEVLSTIAVTVALLRFARDILRYMWAIYGLDGSLFGRIPMLRNLARAIGAAAATSLERSLAGMLPALGWLALALLLALIVRNSLPTVRTSARGMLVEFAGDWLPIPWESLRGIKVTEDLGAQHYVLLAETERSQLTGWHRFYSAIYNFSFRRGFLITSWISNFDRLVKTVLSESDRVARVLDSVTPARLQEEATSPLFRFLLGPASFFSQRTKTETAVTPSRPAAVAGSNVRGAYPRRITSLITWGSWLLIAAGLVRYLIAWLSFLALTFPSLLNRPIFNRLTLLQAQQAAPWWTLVAGHLLLLLVIGLAQMLQHLLPELEARGEGLAVRWGARWVVVPWSRITALKVTEFSEKSQVVLVQTRGGLPFSARLASLIYDAGFTPGVLVTSALNTFEALMQRVVVEVTRHMGDVDPDESPILQSEAHSPLLLLSFRAGTTIDRFVEESREDQQTKIISAARLLRAGRPMFILALLPALLVFSGRALHQGILPNLSLIIGMLVLFVLGVLEWPLISLAAQMLDEATGGGEEGGRPLYLYPLVQLPRLLPMLGALVAVLLGVPFLPILFWLGAIFWSFLLSAGLWEGLYGWRGGQLLAGGLMPVVFQLIILLAYLIALG